MPLVTLKEILTKARRDRYAVGGFNFNGYEDAQGIVDAAAVVKSPAILMLTQAACRHIGLHQAVGLANGMAKAVNIPICLHLDHATDPDFIKEAIKAGFSSVMVDASAKEYEANIDLTKEIVGFARSYGCSVEAELGKVGGKEDHIVVEDPASALTLPSDVPRFVEETGIDALAIAFGSAHGFYKSEPRLNFERLGAILKVTDRPLVLHGGTGIPLADIQKCIAMGLAKINIGTELKAIFSSTLREICARLPDCLDPKEYMGPVKDAVAESVKEKLIAFGSENKA